MILTFLQGIYGLVRIIFLDLEVIFPLNSLYVTTKTVSLHALRIVDVLKGLIFSVLYANLIKWTHSEQEFYFGSYWYNIWHEAHVEPRISLQTCRQKYSK